MIIRNEKKEPAWLLAAVTCALALCLVLAGCGGGGSDKGGGSGTDAPAAARSDAAGYWEGVGGTSSDAEITTDDMMSAKELGFSFILHLADDGTGTLDMFGELEDVTWDGDAKTITTPSDGATMSYEVEGDQLVLSDASGSFTFARGTDDLAESLEHDRQAQAESASGAGIADGSDSQAQTVAIDPITIADDGLCRIVISEKAVDDWGDAGYTVEIQNKSDKKIVAWIPSDMTAVDGTMTEAFFNATLLAGANSTDFLYFDRLDSLDQLVNVQTTIEIFDADTYDDLAKYDVSIP